MNDLKVHDVRVLPGDSAFLIDNGHTSVLIDTGFGFTGEGVAENVRKHLGARPLDYIFLTHSHYDHVLGAPHLARAYPDVKIVAGEYAAGIFQRPGAKAVMRDLDAKAAQKFGAGAYQDLTDELRVDIPVKDGDAVHAGSLEFVAVGLPGHTRCSVGFYLPSHKFLVAVETLGVYFGEGSYMPAYLVGYQMAMDSFEKARRLDVEHILSPHYGLLGKEESRRFLEESQAVSRQVAIDVRDILLAGGTDEDAVEHVRQTRYAAQRVKEVQPVDAFNLNTSIMVALIRKELVERAQ